MIEQFLAKNYSGAPFQIFGGTHLAALVVVVLLNLYLLGYRKKGEPARRRIRLVMAAILVLNEIGWHIWNYTTGQWNIQTMLPLHLCSALVWLGALMLVTKSQFIYDFAYLLGIAGALQALLTPDLGIYGYPHYRFFQTFISHGLIVTSAIYMTVVEEFRPTWRSLLRVLVWGNIYMAAVFGINQLIGSNYLYIAHKPETASLLDVLPPWPWYILWIEAIGIVSTLLLYSPFAIKDWRDKRRMKRAGASRLDEILS
ncbi:MAG: TIGR02206 family membrane protein [Chloroflexi bacterium]|nr:TIGR02206 family membrane protein [Chloroflexota bacterium]